MVQPAVDDAIDFARIRRVLVIKLRHHGDVLLTSPVFSVLKRAAPHVEVDALVYRETAPMLDRHPAISIVHTIDRRLKQRGRLPMLRAELRLWRALRGRRYDLVIHLTEHPRGAWLTRLVGARYAVALDRVDAGVWWRSSFTHLYLLPRHTERHVVEQNLDALRRIGIWPEESDKALVLVPGAAADACVAALMARHKLARGRFVIMHPGSRWQFKSWTATANAAIVDLLAAEGWRVVLTAAPDPSERVLTQAIRAAAQAPVIDLSGELTLPELGALIGAARMLIGVDSAPMHMAAAMQTPVVALFGPSSETAWGPWRVMHRVVGSTIHPCRPCNINGCGGSNVSDCLLTLPVAPVAAALRELLVETADRCPP
ncbi:MAG: putative lipopolysaccharide heptosyltransferase III [Betaproteobacteria bacterium]|nr:MAG: putative lipopolysaccharide heptosyltransferase III [Betaproteobacteria bacterium]